ncbi:hypothetical protein GCK72_007660 [Caenorhabditis remanei]|uniref:BTB domain-containing protein n=1 Tax=Caenorhabditis remanei TaxID=31234 RepID=A0A6A5HKP3_CAERE|nr:hypothetical protein GCK72_007664 [Caenorhabditis remanei]XP_053590546.1 hypothetical protein GCK72_007656 [Caenorhabditis remanei]XP_053590550.1 hypothetical protein GCK72_007660 [Caenorhabditis remanei]KAF1767697.1 hypothetical protein GCK72_007656 [Caenorhabditis remanei]KAF1767701.1 hypothetical protein GCK72_007660 [Caenorhabditis remanei]KAF1767705.1 hypothetical protein GCK72_007664 [Caenorhabditis remanei]
MSTAVKEFVLTYVMENISTLKENERFFGPIDHFNVPWRIGCVRAGGFFSFYVFCDRPKDFGEWAINTGITFELISATGKSFKKTGKDCNYGTSRQFSSWGFSQFVQWETMEKEYAMNDRLVVQAHVVIEKITGIETPKIRHFDESRKILSDVTLIVEDKKFYVSKMILAVQSSYFNSMFYGEFQESKKSEITLVGVNAEDFHYFLELLYLEPTLTNSNVEGVLVLADMYEARNATRLCEEFLIGKSKDSLRNKLAISMKFQLDDLKKHCVESLKSKADIRAVLGSSDGEPKFDSSITNYLLEKTFSLPE